MWNLGDLAERMGGELRGDPGAMIIGFATDSREVHHGSLFLAIRGAQVDGHAYVPDAMAAGAAASVVERPVSSPHIQVPNLVSALAKMARSFRREYSRPVIGVTGSAGKSSTKELLAAALGSGAAKTEGNRNTEFTAPLLWPEVAAVHPEPSAVVVEMGMRGLGQIGHLCSFSEPTIGIITNIGVAHLSELGTRENIALAKSELFEALPEEGVGIYWSEDDFAPLLKERLGKRRALTFGFSEGADAQIVAHRSMDWESSALVIRFDGQEWPVTLPVIGKHFALNAAAAFLGAVTAGVSARDASERLRFAELPAMRMSVVRKDSITFVLDMYNSSPPAVMGALETIREVLDAAPMKSRGAVVAVLGEMRELGAAAEAGHREVGAALRKFGVTQAILLPANPASPAPFILSLAESAVESGLPASNVHVASSHEEVKAFLEALPGPAVVLVKGSRAVELERTLPEGLGDR